jgi:hypothetical protein
MEMDLLHECSVSQTPRFIWIPCKLQAAANCPSVTPVVLQRCESSSLITMEEHRFRVSENKNPKRIFGSKRKEVTEDRKT